MNEQNLWAAPFQNGGPVRRIAAEVGKRAGRDEYLADPLNGDGGRTYDPVAGVFLRGEAGPPALTTICEHETKVDRSARPDLLSDELWRLCPECRADRATYHRVAKRLELEARVTTLTVEAFQLRRANEQALEDAALKAVDAQERLTATDKIAEEFQLEAERLKGQLAAQTEDLAELENTREELETSREHRLTLTREIQKLRFGFGSRNDEGADENLIFIAEQIEQLHETELAKRTLSLEKQVLELTRELQTMSAQRTRALASTDATADALERVAYQTLKMFRPRAKQGQNPLVVANTLADLVFEALKERKAARGARGRR